MTNGDKYQTIKERRKAFEEFCWERHNFCLGCPYFPYQIGDVCFDNWQNAEADEEAENDIRKKV